MCAHALKSSNLLLLHLLLQEAFSSFALVLAFIITSLHFAMRLGNNTAPLTWHEPGSSLACFLLLNLSGTEEKYLVLSESFQRGRSQQKKLAQCEHCFRAFGDLWWFCLIEWFTEKKKCGPGSLGLILILIFYLPSAKPYWNGREVLVEPNQ